MKTIKIPIDLHRLLKVRAAETGKDLQELAEEAIRSWLLTKPQEGAPVQKGKRNKD